MEKIADTALEQTLRQIRQRWGERAIAPLSRARLRDSAALPSGHSAFDALLKGGLPRGAISALIGRPGSGKGRLALQALACEQAEHGAALWLDLQHCFDPAAAQRAGLDLDQLLILRPSDEADGIAIFEDLAALAIPGLMVAQWHERPVPSLSRLRQSLRGSGAAALLLLDSPGPLRRVDPDLALRVSLKHRGWVQEGGQVLAFEALARVERDPRGGQGEALLRFDLPPLEELA